MLADSEISRLIQTLAVVALPTLLAITSHEAAHGIVAYWLGDDTAYRQGRVTLNPVRHIDPFGTVVLPLLLFMVGSVLFGYAKPVPVNAARMRSPRRDMVLVGLAGPGMNLLLAILSAALCFSLPFLPHFALDWVENNLKFSVLINLVIGVFNLLPLPPLDGSHLVVSLLPRRLAIRYAQLGRYGILMVLLAFFILPQLGRPLGIPIDPFGWLIAGPAYWIAGMIFGLLGLSW